MSTTFNKRLLIVWLILTSMTLAYVWMDHTADQNGTLRASTVVTVSAIVIALIKVRIIFREFMEVRHAPALLCRLTDAWVVLIAVCLLGSYFVGSADRRLGTRRGRPIRARRDCSYRVGYLHFSATTATSGEVWQVPRDYTTQDTSEASPLTAEATGLVRRRVAVRLWEWLRR